MLEKKDLEQNPIYKEERGPPYHSAKVIEKRQVVDIEEQHIVPSILSF